MLPVPGGIRFNHSDKIIRLPIQNIDPEYIHLEIPEGYTVNISLGENVKIGQTVAYKEDETESPIYSGISGTAEDISDSLIIIKNDFQNNIYSGLSPIDIPLTDLDQKEIEAMINLMGIYDNGELLSVKLQKASNKIENVIISCTDSEPPLGISHRILSELRKELIGGIKILIYATNARMGIIALSENSTDIYESLKDEISDPKLITTRVVENKYPIENEKYLIYALTRKEYSSENLSENSRCLVISPECAVNLYSSFAKGMPTARKLLTVAGGVKEPKNLSAPIGTQVSQIIDFCGGSTRNDPQIIMGGLMSGKLCEESETVKHSTNCITVAEKKDCQGKHQKHCIRCGKCLDVCPMLLKPLYLYSNIIYGRTEKNEILGIKHCIRCGCCSYICPSEIPLSQTITEHIKNISP